LNSQTIAKAIGESGCYFLSLLHLAGEEGAAIELYEAAVSRKIMGADCFIQDPAALLALAAGGKWSVTHQPAEYQPKSDEMEILRLERKATTQTFAHFVVGDRHGAVLYDPLDSSQTVASGKLVSKRIVRKEA